MSSDSENLQPGPPYMTVRGKRLSTLISAERIAKANAAMAEKMRGKVHRDLLVIAVLKGSFIFAADLIRAMHNSGIAPEVEFITLSSYGSGTESQGVKVLRDIDSDVENRDVLLIDDILESGNTLAFARALMLERGARNVEIAVLLDKHSKRKADLEPDYVGFHCPDHFVVGYGMDVGYAFRELPFVGVVEGDAAD